MAKPTTKTELIRTATEQFDKLWKIVDKMSDAEQIAYFCFDTDNTGEEAHWKRDKNLRDVLAHLYEWHQLLIEWEKANSCGENKSFLPIPYTWKTYGEMNVEFWRKHQKTLLPEIKEMLKSSHSQALSIISKYTEEELFTKAFFKWTGTTSLGQYCISATASHYDWAMKKLKVQIKALDGLTFCKSN